MLVSPHAGELFGAVPGLELLDGAWVRSAGGVAQQCPEFGEVVLVTAGDRGLEEYRGGPAGGVGEGVRDAGRDIHERPGLAAQEAVASAVGPGVPVGRGAVEGLEAQHVELAIDDGEHLLPVVMHVRSDVEAGSDGHLERGGEGRVVVRHQQSGVDRAAGDDPAAVGCEHHGVAGVDSHAFSSGARPCHLGASGSIGTRLPSGLTGRSRRVRRG